MKLCLLIVVNFSCAVCWILNPTIRLNTCKPQDDGDRIICNFSVLCKCFASRVIKYDCVFVKHFIVLSYILFVDASGLNEREIEALLSACWQPLCLRHSKL